jgi:serine/threonine protein kinase
MTNYELHRSLADTLAEGSLPYDRFLKIAVSVAEQLRQLHENQTVHGELSTSTILVDGSDNAMLLDSPPCVEETSVDLLALGKVFYELLTGKAYPEDPKELTLNQIYPVEAMLLVEKLLGLHPTGPMVSAEELKATLLEMAEVYTKPNEVELDAEKSGSPRLYLIISLVVLVLLLIWIIFSLYFK